MPKKFWQFRNQAADSAELLLYGDISDSSWWGDEVTPKTFADELNALGPLTSLTVRINSGGGDVFAAQTIGNLLEQHTAQVTARIDGLCASAATIIACHCDKVVAANDSTYMIHPVRMGIFDFADAVTLQQYIGALNTIRENILNLYTKKTGREKDEVAAWMVATSWWTGEEAKTNGFVDELVDDGEKTVVENRGGLLFVNSVNMNLPFDKAPKFVQNSVAAAPAASGFVNTQTPAEKPGNNSHKKNKSASRAPAGESIEQRPEEIDEREEFGHWEGDTVYSGKGKRKTTRALLTLTERKTRKEIIIAIPNRKAETVVKALDALERKLGARRFRAIFKSITFDNGTEFAAAEELERSCVNKRLPRTKVYFCHPYSSWERGTNENTNGMIRRRFPKGTNFAAVTNAQIAQAENWINNYPRKILGYKSSEIVFRECLRELGIAA